MLSPDPSSQTAGSLSELNFGSIRKRKFNQTSFARLILAIRIERSVLEGKSIDYEDIIIKYQEDRVRAFLDEENKKFLEITSSIHPFVCFFSLPLKCTIVLTITLDSR